ncbi:MAG: RibD family protein [Chloroflexota bacterium]|nr:MAG: RibD family protein [Chloroflexota bacterium]
MTTLIDPNILYLDLAFPYGPDERPYVVINMIATADGKATVAGRSSTIGSPLDRLMMRRIRAAADGILTGAGTLRAENIDPTLPPNLQQRRIAQGRSPNPIAAILSGSGELPLERRFFSLAGFQRVVFVSAAAPSARIEALKAHAQVFLLDPGRPALRQVMRTFRTELGVGSLLVEGGPRLNAELIHLGYVDELFLTIAPKIVGGSGKTITEGTPLRDDQIRRLELVSVATQGSELFLRYRFV